MIKTYRELLLGRLAQDFNLSKITTVVVPLCLGDPNDTNDGCHARFAAGIENLDPETTLVIQTGGSENQPLCDQMKVRLSTTNPTWERRFLSIVLGWGTRAEVANALMIIQELRGVDGIRINNRDFKVIFSSNFLHLRRIKWFVKLHNFNNHAVEYRRATHHFSLHSTIREIIGLPYVKRKDCKLGQAAIRINARRDFCDAMNKL